MTGPRRSKKDLWERWVEDGVRGRHLREPSEATLRKALALGSQLRSRSGSSWLVALLFDSAAQPLPAGVRSTAVGPRRLLFQAKTDPDAEVAYQLDLRVRRAAEGTIELTGQLLPPWDRARIETRSGRSRRSRSLDESGEFLLRDLPAKAETLNLTIRGADGGELVFPEIVLEPPAGESS